MPAVPSIPPRPSVEALVTLLTAPAVAFPDEPVIADWATKQRRAEAILARVEPRTAHRQGPESPVAQAIAAADAGDSRALGRLGIRLDYAWLDDVLAAMISGSPGVEIEAVGPYASHHVDDSGEFDVSAGNLPDDERTGILLAGFFRDIARECRNVRIVSLLDDLNTPVRPLTRSERDSYVLRMWQILHDHQVLLPGDLPGRDYVLLRETSQLSRLDELVRRLETSGEGVVERPPGGDLIFRPSRQLVEKLGLRSESRRRELLRRGILLRRAGRPTCHALDAATFLGPLNDTILHLVVLPRSFESEQDKTYALIRALGVVTQDSYHNVFYDNSVLSPDDVVRAIAACVRHELRRFLELGSLFDQWEAFDPDEYASRNYGERLLAEDESIIDFVVRQLEASGLPLAVARRAADVGAGPNLYPAMLTAPYLSDDGAIDLIEYAERNRAHLEQLLADPDRATPTWKKFEDLMVERGGERYAGALSKVSARARVRAGSVFELPAETYDLAASYFVSESITTSRMAFRMAIRSLAATIKRDGVLTIAHMIGSDGWHAGEGTRFPAVRLSPADIEQAYRDADLTFTTHYANAPAGQHKARDGYHGMMVVIAHRTR